jgi:hypothetical protein
MAGDLSKVAKSRYYSPAKAARVWKALFNEHIQKNGLPENYVQYVEKMKKAVDHYAKAYNGKKWLIVKAKVYQAEADQLLQGEGERIETTCARLSKYMGFPVRANECSVTEFYNYIELLKN